MNNLTQSAVQPAANTPPYHQRATIHFASVPTNGQSLGDYAGELLAAYDKLFANATPAALAAANVSFVSSAALVPLKITDEATVIASLPPVLHGATSNLASALATSLGGVYPLLPGETIESGAVGILAEAIEAAPAGCAVYSRKTNFAVVDFILPYIRFDATTGAPSVVPLIPGAPTTPTEPLDAPPEVVSTRLLGASNGMQVIEGVATNFAFILPAPWGPIAAGGLTGLFGIMGDLFGSAGGSDPQLVAISQMIAAAVTEIENYWAALNVTAIQSDVQLFFNWCGTNLPSVVGGPPDAGVTDASIGHWIADILPKLEDTSQGFARTTLANDLTQLSVEQYVKGNVQFDRANDQVLEVIELNVTALICALKLQANLHAVIAAYYAPGAVDGYCSSLAADEAFQFHTLAWSTALGNLASLVSGTPEASDDPDEDKMANFGLDASCAAIAATYPTGGTSDDMVFVQTRFGTGTSPSPLNLSAYAERYGWVKALQRLVLHRQMARVLQLSPLQYFDNRSTTCEAPGGVPVCSDGGYDGYQVIDQTVVINTFNINRWSSGCCSQNEHDNQGLMAAIGGSFWQTRFAGVVGGVKSDYADDLTVADGWAKGIVQMLAACPVLNPPNGATLADLSWQANPPANSQWQSAVNVQYAFSFVTTTNGPGLRSAWTAPVAVNKQFEPTLRHLPSIPFGLQMQVWRQFVFKDLVGDPVLMGLPKIVGTISSPWTPIPGTTQYTENPTPPFTDMDQAITAVGLPEGFAELAAS